MTDPIDELRELRTRYKTLYAASRRAMLLYWQEPDEADSAAHDEAQLEALRELAKIVGVNPEYELPEHERELPVEEP